MSDLGIVVFSEDGPRSSCCGATITVQKDYTDTHAFTVDSCETDDDGNVTAVTYKFVKTHDGIDGENFRAQCDKCGREIDTDEIDFEES